LADIAWLLSDGADVGVDVGKVLVALAGLHGASVFEEVGGRHIEGVGKFAEGAGVRSGTDAALDLGDGALADTGRGG
jgi:hypothetical protein